MLSWIVHYKNKYPGGRVMASENALDVYDVSGDHVVAKRKNGAGMWSDESEKLGCTDRHDLSPIPKDSRVHKVQNGAVGLDELADQRMESRKSLLRGNKILSEKEYEAEKSAKEKADKASAAPKAVASKKE